MGERYSSEKAPKKSFLKDINPLVWMGAFLFLVAYLPIADGVKKYKEIVKLSEGLMKDLETSGDVINEVDSKEIILPDSCVEIEEPGFGIIYAFNNKFGVDEVAKIMLNPPEEKIAVYQLIDGNTIRHYFDGWNDLIQNGPFVSIGDWSCFMESATED